MTRNHFAKYREESPEEYQAFADSMWNGFVSITKHIPIVNRFFSFTPEFLEGTIDYEDLDAGQALGEALGEVYGFSQGIPIDLFDDTKSL